MAVDYGRFQLTPDLSGFSERVAEAFKDKRRSDEKAQLGELSRQVLAGDEGRDESLARIASIDPQTATAVGALMKTQQADKLAKAERAATENARLATYFLSIEDPKKRRAAMMGELQQRHAQGQPTDKLMEVLNVPDTDSQRMVLRKQQIMNTDIGKVIGQQLQAQLGPLEYSKFFETDSGGLVGVTKQGQAAPVELDGQRLRDKTPRTEVNVDASGKRETKFAETVGKGFGDQYLAFQESAQSARSGIARLNRAEQLVESVATGSLQPTAQGFKRLAKSAGVDLGAIGITDDTAPAEALEALGTEFALEAVNDTKGAVSDREMAMFQQMAPGLARTPEGNKLIIQMAKRMKDLDIQTAALARRYYQQAGRFDEGFYDELDQFHARNPLFSRPLQAKAESLLNVSGADSAERPVAVGPDGDEIQWNPETGRWEPI